MKNSLEFNKFDVLTKSNSVFKNKKNILVSYSGGKDSDVMINLLNEFDLLKNVK